MELKTIEGTWEEVERRAGELAGRRVRVIVLDEFEAAGRGDEGRAESPEATAFDVMFRAGLVGCLKATPGGPSDLATNPAHLEGFGGE